MSSVRIPFFILALALALFAPLSGFLLCVALYLLWYPGRELLIITVVVDALYGSHTTDIVYTVSVGALILFATLVRPYMSWYTEA